MVHVGGILIYCKFQYKTIICQKNKIKQNLTHCIALNNKICITIDMANEQYFKNTIL